MLYISDISSLSFRDNYNDYERHVDFSQIFSITDNPLVQARSYYTLQAYVYSISEDISYLLTPDVFTVNGISVYTWNVLSLNLALGCYEFRIYIESISDIQAKAAFTIADDECLEDTVLIAGTGNKNLFDTYFINPVTGRQYTFQLRFHGGFKTKEIGFYSDDESFRDQNYTGHLMSSFPYYNRTLTIGKNGFGVPVWYGLIINMLFALPTVTINGEGYRKSDSSNPELLEMASFYPFVIFKIDVEPSNLYSLEQGDNSIFYTDNTQQQLTDNLGNLLTSN